MSGSSLKLIVLSMLFCLFDYIANIYSSSKN
nr:MAG TPA: hypothetical protein [Bacteriophage sp.]